MDSVNHVLDEGLLRSSKSSSVGDVEDTVVGLGVLTVDTSNLDVVLVSDGVELLLLLHELWKLDVDGGSESGTEIGWARGDVTEMLVMGELDHSLDVSGGSAESVEDLEDTGTLLHGDDSELVLLVDPDEESLGVVVEDTSAGWPISVEVASLQESIALPIIN